MLLRLRKLTALTSLTFLIILSCQKPENPDPLSKNEKTVSSFVLNTTDNPSLSTDVLGTIVGDSIKIVLPTGSALGNYRPTISYTGKSLTPESKTTQNFANSLTYTVTAEDGSTKTYLVTTGVQQASDKNITAFQFKAVNNNGTVASDASGIITMDSVYLTVPYGTSLTNLVPTITITGKMISPASAVAQNFTNIVSYAVTAEDGSTKTYRVKVAVEMPSATVYATTVYDFGAPGTARLYAIDANTGSLKWEYGNGASPVPYSTGAFAAGVIYTVFENNVIALDVTTRLPKWTYTIAARPSSAPCVVDGRVYINANDQKLYAIDANTGTLLWTFTESAKINSSSVNYSGPTVANGVVYFGSDDNYVYALDAITGALKWKTLNVGSFGTKEFQSSACVANGVLYIGDNLRNLIAYNTIDGSEKWRYQGADGGVFSSPTVDNGTVYVGSYSRYLYAIDAGTGTLKWRYLSPAKIYSSPTVANGVVFFGSSGNTGSGVYALSASTGTLKWNVSTSYEVSSSPVVFNNTLYVGTDVTLKAFDAVTGTLKWQFMAPTVNAVFTYSSPYVVDANSNVYYSSLSGHKQ